MMHSDYNKSEELQNSMLHRETVTYLGHYRQLLIVFWCVHCQHTPWRWAKEMTAETLREYAETTRNYFRNPWGKKLPWSSFIANLPPAPQGKLHYRYSINNPSLTHFSSSPRGLGEKQQTSVKTFHTVIHPLRNYGLCVCGGGGRGDCTSMGVTLIKGARGLVGEDGFT